MPSITLPPELCTEVLNCVGYTTPKLLALPGRQTLKERILEECGVSDNASAWVILNCNRSAELSEEELKGLDKHARVHLAAAAAPRPPPRKELRLRDASVPASRGHETVNYISAEPRHDFMNFLSINSSVNDAWLEWLDNGAKALHGLPPGAPREVWFGHYVDRAGVKHLFVRDSGVGMSPARLEVWPSLGNAARDEPEPAHVMAADYDPRVPFAPGLGQWHVGAKTGIAVLTGDTGRTEVYTRAASDPCGCDGDIAYLIFDKALARARDEACRSSVKRAEDGYNW